MPRRSIPFKLELLCSSCRLSRRVHAALQPVRRSPPCVFLFFAPELYFQLPERTMAGKIIVANYAALQKKYDVKALKPILAAVDELIVADKARGIVSKIVDISSAPQMKRYKGKAVTREKNERQAKDAVDAIYAATRADYLAILDGPDVIPHLTLTNHIDDDPDDAVPSDLPYASD